VVVSAFDISDDFDPIQLLQTRFQLPFFDDDFIRQYFGELPVEIPELFELQCVQIRLAHRRPVRLLETKAARDLAHHSPQAECACFPGSRLGSSFNKRKKAAGRSSCRSTSCSIP
jgi:hypothetical protein